MELSLFLGVMCSTFQINKRNRILTVYVEYDSFAHCGWHVVCGDAQESPHLSSIHTPQWQRAARVALH